ncbi:MAG: MCP four helix bundle domain-containing protein [Fibrobacterota bacterium]|nr:MCP four helix bundle domain-containing protein [Fibrobacterota bacterium]QQS04013.1 MAG: MCP four helix bundle domain-containing protein [Fibrobacterota bacterium]
MFKNMKLALRLGLGFGLLVVLMIVVGGIALDRIGKINDGIILVVKDRMPKMEAANNWINGVNAVARILRNGVISDDPAFIAKEFDRIAEERHKIDKAYKSLEEGITSKEGKAKLEAASKLIPAIRDGQEKIIGFAKAGKDSAAAAELFGDYRKVQSEYLAAIADLIKFQSELADQDGDAAAKMASMANTLIIGLIILAGILAVLVAWLVTRSITRPIGNCIEIAEKVAKGDTTTEIKVESTDETGMLMEAMARMVRAIQLMSGDASTLAMAAVEGKLATRADATKHQGDFRKIVQGVNDTLDAVIGPLNVTAKYVDDISKGVIPPTITDNYNGDFNVIKGNLNAVVKMMGDLLKETDGVIKAAADGELDKRANASLFLGGWNQLVCGVNDTITNIVNPLMVTADYVEKVSKGVIPPTITDVYKGQYNLIKNNLNAVVKMMSDLLTETDGLVKAALGGSLSTRANANLFVGGWNQLVAGVNKTLDSVLEPINEAAGVLDKVAARDLTARVMGNYQGDHAKIKDSLNLAVDNLEKALSQVADATGQVSNASQQIAGGSQNLAQGANEQASSLEQVSASLEEMSSMTRQSADNALAAKNLSGEADTNTKQGSEAMVRMSSAINKIKESSDQTAKIVKTIDEIAMQTNLLALNAAVEAARAGEAGRGFAVVAEEVRNLAQRSAQAAKSTADMISESVRNADDGVKIVVDVAGSLDKIAISTRKVNDLIAEIASSAKEQSQGIREVSEAVSQMDKVTQQNAANAEESASASEELSSQAEELSGMVAQFKLRTSGNSTAPVQTLRLAHSAPSAARTQAPPKAKAHKPGMKTISAEQSIPMDDDALREF